MKLNRKDLFDIVDKLMLGVLSKETIQQSTMIAFVDGLAVTYNDRIMLAHTLDLDGISCAVPAKELYDLLNKSKDEFVELEKTDKQLEIKGVKFSATFAIHEEVLMPIHSVPKPKRRDWDKVGDDFISALRAVIGCASSNAVKPILTAIHLTDKFMEACDTFKMARVNCSCPVEVNLPASVASVLMASGMAPVEMATKEGWLHFKDSAGFIFSCRSIEGDYPALDGFLVVPPDAVGIKFPKEIKDSLERASIFAEKDLSGYSDVSLVVDKKTITISSQGTQGKFKETLDQLNKVEPFSLIISPVHFLAMLDKAETFLYCSGDRSRFVAQSKSSIFIAATREV